MLLCKRHAISQFGEAQVLLAEAVIALFSPRRIIPSESSKT
jgi:hypothetical protein